MPSKHVLANREANSRHAYDITIWLSRTTDNSNIFIRSREVRDNESRLYFEKGAWYMSIMNKFIRSNFMQNLNKILIVINTMEVAEIQVVTMLLL